MSKVRVMSDLHLEFGPLGLEPAGEDVLALVGDILRGHLPRRYHEGPVVVLTHHLPSKQSVAGRYANDELSPAYASNLDDLVEASGAALWCHGHTHVSQDYCIGGTRVVCNPRGYAGYELNPMFDPNLVIGVT